MKFKDMLDRQKIFSDLFFDSASFNDLKKEEMTKSFALAAHGEITDLVSSINFKEHRANRKTPDREKILYESVDAFRYLLAIMNVWGYASEEIESAFTDKDTYLHMRHKSENARVAEIIGVNKAARVTTVKPSGTTSLVLGTASGIHAWHNDYYIRRIRVGKNEAIYNYLE